MEAIRKIVTVKDNILTVVLPDSYNDKKVELIILPAEELKKDDVQEPKVDYSKYYGAIKSNMTIEEIDRELKSLRDEWERDIS